MNKARRVPYAYRPKVKAKSERLTAQGVITPVDVAQHTTTPLVVVPKPNGSIQICGDFKVSVNPHLNAQSYPKPTCSEVFQTLAGGQRFTKLDLTDAYQQLELDDESKKYVIYTTHKGLYRVNRLAFGLSCAPAIFQSVIEQVLTSIPHVQPYLDDIVVTGATSNEHLTNLRQCFTTMRAAGIRLRRDKCRFFADEIEHLGHVLDRQGFSVNKNKAAAIRAATAPLDKQSLESWLGMAQYYADFISKFFTLAGPLNELRRADVPYEWNNRREAAFFAIKAALAEGTMRSHLDESKPVLLATDASPYGVGAVLLQKKDGRKHMVTCALRTLTTAERNYSELEREALGIVFGFKRFRQFLAGRHVTLYTDHKPLTYIFKPDAGVLNTALPRIQRWALFLATFDYSVHNRPGKENFQADFLSRSPHLEQSTFDVEVCAVQAQIIKTGPVDVVQVRQATRRDPVLSRVIEFAQLGWPTKAIAEELQPYFRVARN